MFDRPELVTVMSSIGNKMANSIWEANTKGRLKPLSTSPRFVLLDIILVIEYLILSAILCYQDTPIYWGRIYASSYFSKSWVL